MRNLKIASSIVACSLACALAACGSKPTPSFKQSALDDANGIKVEAVNAEGGASTTSGGAITVKEGDVIVISPVTESGNFHLTIAPTGGGAAIYDEDVKGSVLFNIEAAPGTYDVTTTTSSGVTGDMTVFAQSKAEFDAMDASLADALEKEGIDPSSVLETTGSSTSSSASN